MSRHRAGPVDHAARLLDHGLDRLVAPGFSTVGYAVRRRLPSWPADAAPGSLDGQHVAVTGATSGLGLATAKGAARLGAHVHLVVRDTDKGERVVAELPEGQATVWRCDVSDLDSVAAFARELTAAVPRIDALVHNAGALPPRRTESAQGHEMTMALHLLGPLAMTEALRPVLAGHHARVVMVSSGGMYAQKLRADDPDYHEQPYSGTTAYARSKRAQVTLLPLMQRRWHPDGMEVHGMHPGWADSPGLTASLPRFASVLGPALRSADAGVDTTLWLLATPKISGGRFWHDRQPRRTHLLPTTRVDHDDVVTMWRWALGAAGLRA